MSVNGITNSNQIYDSKSSVKAKSDKSQQASDLKEKGIDNTAAVYEKTEEKVVANKSYKPDMATINKLKADAERRTESLRNLVEKLMLKQGQTFDASTDIYALLREGKVEVDDETRAQAQKDIAEDGYWGIEQTSERIVSFAKALAGGDPAKAEELINAVKKGFDEATKAWGDELPEICKKTLDTAVSKLESWRDEINNKK